MAFKPTAEQEAIIEAFDNEDHLIIQAGAGTGKTTTLREAAKTATQHRGLYVAFNKSVQREAERTFGPGVRCRTAHALAYAHQMRTARGQALIEKMDNAGYPSDRALVELAFAGERPFYEYEAKGIDSKRVLPPERLARVALGVLSRWCQSADPEITKDHLWIGRDWMAENPRQVRDELWSMLAGAARRFQSDVFSANGTTVRYSFEHFLKQWQLDDPVLKFDYIFLDEAQDASPVIADVFLKQAEHAQLVAVGDSMQAIYGFTGAIDALDKMKRSGLEHTELFLTESWRFGPPIAGAANNVLAMLPTQLQIKGNAGPSALGEPDYLVTDDSVPDLLDVDAVLVRTNADAVKIALAAVAKGLKPYMVVDVSYMLSFFRGAKSLMEGRRSSHADLVAFDTWEQFLAFVKSSDEAQADFQVLINLINDTGIDQIIDLMEEIIEIEERDADVVVSTAHKAKGLEWDKVAIHGFRNVASEPERMLLYVAYTRAREELHPGPTWPMSHYGLPFSGITVTSTSDDALKTLLREDTPEAEFMDIARGMVAQEDTEESLDHLLDKTKIREMASAVLSARERAREHDSVIEAFLEGSGLESMDDPLPFVPAE